MEKMISLKADTFKNITIGSWRVGSVVTCTYCSYRRPECNFLAPMLSIPELPLIQPPGDPMNTHVFILTQAHKQIHTIKNKLFLKLSQ